MKNTKVIMKVCSKCKIEKEYEEYHRYCRSKDGYKNMCKSCIYECNKKNNSDKPELLKNRKNRYYENNKDSCILASKKWRENNKEKFIKKIKEYKENNLEKTKLYQKDYRIQNKENINNSRKERKKIDKLYGLSEIIRNTISSSLKNKGFSKKSKTYEILGCSFKEFQIYLETKFEAWMNWDNHGRYTGNYNETWHIDHIIPISSAETEEELYKLNHYANFQPLCSKINQVDKRDKINYF